MLTGYRVDVTPCPHVPPCSRRWRDFCWTPECVEEAVRIGRRLGRDPVAVTRDVMGVGLAMRVRERLDKGTARPGP